MESKTDSKQQKKAKRQRRQYTPEFKAGAVRLVLAEGRSVTQVAKDLDLTRSALDGWVQQARADAERGPAGTLTRPTSGVSAAIAAAEVGETRSARIPPSTPWRRASRPCPARSAPVRARRLDGQSDRRPLPHRAGGRGDSATRGTA